MTPAAPVVAAIGVFPVKSLGGVSPRTASARPAGLKGDRRWMAVDAHGRFLTQRGHPRMALIEAAPTADGIRLSRPGAPSIAVAAPHGGETVRATVWRDRVEARLADPAAAAWLSEALGVACRLAFMDDETARRCDPAWASPGDPVSFADGFPILLANAASLADLNRRLDAPVAMARFRPNLVVEGAAPWAEDRWTRLSIGAAVLRVAKPCARCVITTIDPRTGERPDPEEPLRTLRRFRRDRALGGAMFGQNLVVERPGGIAVGDPVVVLATGAPNVTPIHPG